ncbi:RNA granule protein invertebrate isoform X2 [Strongylocentrotus purpuratus]|uniref:Caprin-1 dimerization domain-containing protein n=1 Tax=Strongylocentrotus purpuratus TaxID=7668 RepID=A0A7M7P3G9_STRPU|nr:RNA granule protein invertebrate isoform X2 [Strongylocentrotus purpuratus]
MPAASSKPAPQTTPLEGQDTAKYLFGVVEKKIRNLEKRKTKLDGYRELVTSGKVLNKDQEEAVSHFEEVGASLEFAKELSKQFTTILSEANKVQKREAKRGKQQKHEQEVGRISEVLLLQNVLFHMGQDHVRADFLAGTNGALHLQEEELSHLDEFFKLVSPSREGDEEEEETTEENISFDKKLEIATSHLNSYLKEDEREACQSTYKDMFHLVQRIHKCGYLENIPTPPEDPAAEDPAPAAVAPAAAYEAPEQEEVTYEQETPYQENEQEFVESLNEAPSESFFTGAPSEQMQQAPGMQSAQNEAPQMQSMSSETQQHQPQGQQTHGDMAPSSRVHDLPHAPEPIEMPPPKQAHHDVNEVLAPVLGSFNFVQDSMLDYDSPHMDPAVVAVSQQPFIPSSTFTNNVQSSTDMSQTDQGSQPGHQTLADSLAAQQQQIPTEQSYQQQSRYDCSQQTYGSQSLSDQTPYTSQTMDGGNAGYAGQADLSSASSAQVDYGSSQTSSTSGKLNELQEFPSPPVDSQQDQSVLQTTMLNQQNLSHSAQYNESYSQSLGSGQLGNDGVTSSSSPLTIDPSQASIPLPGEQTTSDVQQGSIPPKSTMNASAPPFQMTNSMRSSPQMQAMQSAPAGQVGQPQDMGAYTGMDQSQDFNHSAGRDVDRTHSPSQDMKMDHQQQSEGPGNSYGNSYQPQYYKNGRGGKPRGGGGNPNFRGSRGNAPFIRGGTRYTAPQQRGGGGGQMNFNTFGGHRDAFAPRGPDMSYNPNARYGGFNQVQQQQDQSYYNRRGGGMPRGGGNRGGGRGAQGGPRNQAPYRGGRGSFGKPSQVTV